MLLGGGGDGAVRLGLGRRDDERQFVVACRLAEGREQVAQGDVGLVDGGKRTTARSRASMRSSARRAAGPFGLAVGPAEASARAAQASSRPAVRNLDMCGFLPSRHVEADLPFIMAERGPRRQGVNRRGVRLG